MEILENLELFFTKIGKNPENKIAKILLKKAMTISVAESCTGGLVSSRLTDISGSSAFVKANFVTYSDKAKMEYLGVSQQTLDQFSAVSEECALEMVKGLYNKLNQDEKKCDVVLATTGYAGPGGDAQNQNIGLMFVAIKSENQIKVKKFELDPNTKRKVMKYLFSQKALEFLMEFLKNE